MPKPPRWSIETDMSRRPHQKKTDAEPREPKPAPPKMPSPIVRRLIGLAVTLHVAAVFIAPFSMAPASELGGTLHGWFRPYIEIADLNYGYKFFAPEPGPGNSFKAVLKFEDGHTEEKMFPDLDEQWPRLFYHRHMMLSEFLQAGAVPSIPDAIVPGTPEYREAKVRFEAMAPPRKVYDAVVNSYAQQILQKYGATEVTLHGSTRYPPTAQEFIAGRKLTDPGNVRPIKLGTFRRDDR